MHPCAKPSPPCRLRATRDNAFDKADLATTTAGRPKKQTRSAPEARAPHAKPSPFELDPPPCHRETEPLLSWLLPHPATQDALSMRHRPRPFVAATASHRSVISRHAAAPSALKPRSAGGHTDPQRRSLQRLKGPLPTGKPSASHGRKELDAQSGVRRFASTPFQQRATPDSVTPASSHRLSRALCRNAGCPPYGNIPPFRRSSYATRPGHTPQCGIIPALRHAPFPPVRSICHASPHPEPLSFRKALTHTDAPWRENSSPVSKPPLACSRAASAYGPVGTARPPSPDGAPQRPPARDLSASPSERRLASTEV